MSPNKLKRAVNPICNKNIGTFAKIAPFPKEALIKATKIKSMIPFPINKE